MNEFYTKLYSTITASSIWQESKEVKILWVTMLAMADRFGDVSASIPGLAAIANLTISECETALKKLLAPDTYSRSKDYEGRRIEVVDGGWHILNYSKYRNRRDPDKRREQNKQAQRRFRKKTRKPKISHSKPLSAHQDKEQDKEKKENVVARRLSELLMNLILEQQETFRDGQAERKEKTIERWTKDIDLMIRFDHRTPERIGAVIRWALADPFWRANILSAKKLREKFDTLELQLKRKTNAENRGHNRDYAVSNTEAIVI